MVLELGRRATIHDFFQVVNRGPLSLWVTAFDLSWLLTIADFRLRNVPDASIFSLFFVASFIRADRPFLLAYGCSSCLALLE